MKILSELYTKSGLGGSWHWFGGSSNTKINISVTVFVFVYGVKKAATPAILSILRQEERGYAHDTCVILFYFWLCWVFVAFSSCRERGLLSSWQRTGFSLQWLLLLRTTGCRHSGLSGFSSRALERGRGSCSSWAKLLHGMRGLRTHVPLHWQAIHKHWTSREARHLCFF